MVRGSFGQYLIAATDLKEFRNLTVGLLTGMKFRIFRAGVNETNCKIVAYRGSSLFAMLARQIPFFTILGIWSRTRATIICRKSLNVQDTELRLSIRVDPIQEMTDFEEEWVTQDLGEYWGDNRQCRRQYSKIIKAYQGKIRLATPGGAPTVSQPRKPQ